MTRESLFPSESSYIDHDNLKVAADEDAVAFMVL